MKMIPGLTLAVMFCTAAMGQPATDTPPPQPANPAPAATPPQPPTGLTIATTTTTNQPADAKKKNSKKTTAKKPTAPTYTPGPPLVTNQPALARQNNVNVRGQAKINSEVIARLKSGESVTVLEEITLPHPKTDEPAKWAKIGLPSGAHAYVNSMFLNPDKTVKPDKLHVRSGPGENYSVIGMMHKGDTVKETGVKGDWSEIEPPPGAYAFVAAHLLTQTEHPAPPPSTTVVDAGPTVAPPPTTTPTNATAVAADTTNATPQAVPNPLPPAPEEPQGPRIVQREGIVRGTVSIQAPSYFELESLDNGKVIDYLFTSSTNLVLKHWRGKTVLVTGEEGLDERWPNTPVLTIQKIQVVE